MNYLSPDKHERGIWKAFAKNPPVIKDPESIWSNYHVEQGWRRRYYYSDESKKQLVITATHDALKATREDAKTVSAMLDLAEARGWKSVRARGSEEFRREIWIQAQVRGNTRVAGYWETSADMREVANRRTQAQDTKLPETPADTSAIRAAESGPQRSPIIDDLVKRIDRVVSSAERVATPGQSCNRTEIANGWTEREAKAMNAHMDAKAAREWERSEPSAESVRKAERKADATDPIHDARRERQADNYKPTRWHEPTEERSHGRGR